MPVVQPIKIAILAMGGEGGGVLADWIVSLGEESGYVAQTTSVPGVAQRTGATIYYVELFPAQGGQQQPVLALMPMPGDVDVVLASELMEAGRAVQRGLVTPDRTTLITSTHRVYAIGEKTAMGDGRVDNDTLLRHASSAAKQFIRFDMSRAAEQAGSVISAVLFGALYGTGVLPFSESQFTDTIIRGGVGVKPSLAAFALGAQNARLEEAAPVVAQPAQPAPASARVAALLARIPQELPASAHGIAIEGVRRMLDYQDVAYGALYLDRLNGLAQLPGCDNEVLLREAARHLALWMSWEDTIRVADLKIRASRFERVREEVHLQDRQLLSINEYMHPRLDEVCETLPAALGRWLQKPGMVHRLLRSATRKGRVITTSSLGGYLLLWSLSRWRRWRRLTLRYQLETTRITQWLHYIARAAAFNPALALEIVQCQRLVKGYGDTHARGLRNYQILIDIVKRHERHLAPASLRELRDAALADEHGNKLRECQQRLALN
ncbi:indolepyruvate oxidoreductase subunit beta family protein [Shimwellia pseudoproteus]|uniref:indolepyruvate oxidoreductase subunit beta family protein n=1 Tax=Shimwellia pseudoproteus TaxID=570012 RepID=UPI0018EB6D3F|nr:indolepyruvate oxidoreductase subunit beta family protein [Shimwellia pseudoproteus]MBJ3814580.1 indolepyruvate oxidoreductase subunit beta family protein [Shimwellia pseudoproteus]